MGTKARVDFTKYMVHDAELAKYTIRGATVREFI